MNNFFESVFNTIIVFGGTAILWLIVVCTQIILAPAILGAYCIDVFNKLRIKFNKAF